MFSLPVALAKNFEVIANSSLCLTHHTDYITVWWGPPVSTLVLNIEHLNEPGGLFKMSVRSFSPSSSIGPLVAQSPAPPISTWLTSLPFTGLCSNVTCQRDVPCPPYLKLLPPSPSKVASLIPSSCSTFFFFSATKPGHF